MTCPKVHVNERVAAALLRRSTGMVPGLLYMGGVHVRSMTLRRWLADDLAQHGHVVPEALLDPEVVQVKIETELYVLPKRGWRKCIAQRR